MFTQDPFKEFRSSIELVWRGIAPLRIVKDQPNEVFTMVNWLRLVKGSNLMRY